MTDNLGRKTTFTHVNRVFRIQPPGATSPVLAVTYNTNWRVTSVASGSSTWTYAYVDSGGNRTTTVTDPLGGTRQLVSSLSTGLPVSQTNEVGHTTTLQHDGSGRVTRVNHHGGGETRYAYDARGNMTEVRQVQKPHASIVWPDLVTLAQFPASCANPRTCNQPTRTRDTAGQWTDYTYNATHGGVVTVTAPAAVAGGVRPQTRFTYTSMFAFYRQGGTTPVQAPSAVWRLTQTSTCSSGTSPGCVGTANETRTTIGYGSTGVANNRLPVSTTVAAGNGSPTSTTSQGYNAVGDVIWSQPPVGGSAARTHYHYDALRRPVGVIGPDPDGTGPRLRQAARIVYTASGQTAAVERGTATAATLAALNAMSVLERQETEYDILFRPVRARLRGGGATAAILASTEYQYDAANRLLCEAVRMNPASFTTAPAACTLRATGSQGPDRITQYTYDDAGRLTVVRGAHGTAEAGSDIRYGYRADGTLANVRDRAGNRTTYLYDQFNRLIQTRYPTPEDGNVSNTGDTDRWTFDDFGRLASERTRSGHTITYAYDNLGRVAARTTPSGQPDISYQYDLLGRTTQISQSGHTLAFTYDALGRNLTQVTPQGTVSYQYDAASRRTRMTWPDGLYVQYEYDTVGGLTRIRENGATSGVGVLASYTYDNLGRMTQIARGNGVTTSFGYDAASRLASFTQDLAGTSHDVTASFTRNPAGQIASRTLSNEVFAYTGHQNVNHTFTVDGLNRYLTGGGASYSYDARGNMTGDGTRTYGYDFDNRLTTVSGGGQGAVTLSYDPAGRLHQTAQTGGATTRFLYDGANLIGEYNASNALLRRYVHGPGLDTPLVRYDGTGTTTRRWLIADERGSVVAETNASGAAVQVNRYDEYGQPGAGNTSRFGYTGQMWIAEIGLYHYRNRVYNPRLGRFMQTDPIGQAGGLNLYAYVGNDPINYTDPWGLSRISEICYHFTAHDNLTGATWDMGIQCSGGGGGFGFPGIIGIGDSRGPGGGGQGPGSGNRPTPISNQPDSSPPLPYACTDGGQPWQGPAPWDRAVAPLSSVPINSRMVLSGTRSPVLDRIDGSTRLIFAPPTSYWTHLGRDGSLWAVPPGQAAPREGDRYSLANTVRLQAPGTGSAHPDAPFASNYPGGYFIAYNGQGQPISIYDGRTGPPSATHNPVQCHGG